MLTVRVAQAVGLVKVQNMSIELGRELESRCLSRELSVARDIRLRQAVHAIVELGEVAVASSKVYSTTTSLHKCVVSVEAEAIEKAGVSAEK